MVKLLCRYLLHIGCGAKFCDPPVSSRIRIFVRFSVIIQRSAIRRELTKRVMEESPAIMMLAKQIQQFPLEVPHGGIRCPT